MSFSPALGASEVVALLPTVTTLYFTYTPSLSSSSSFASTSTPEVWTNLSGGWSAISFTALRGSPSSPEATPCAQVATFDLTSATPGKYEFTYRLRHSDESYEWLGAANSNGTIDVVSSATAEVRGEKTVELKTFDLKGGKSNDIESFALGIDRHEWTQGVVWERSERIWYLTRQLQHGNPVSSISSDYEAQLLFLRSKPTAEAPVPRILVAFPFSTTDVMSTIRGGDGKVWLRCSRDTDASDAKGNVVIAEGTDGDLKELVAECVKIAKEELGGDQGSVDRSNHTAPGPDGVRVCTWNALGMSSYKLSDVLSWLDSLLSPATSSPLFAAALDTVLLDDGWQDTTDSYESDGRLRRSLHSFGVRPSWYDVAPSSGDSGYGASSPLSASLAEVSSSPELADAVKRIKAKGIERVGVWMTIAGYWDGLDPAGPMSRYALQRWELHSKVFPDSNGIWHLPSIDSLDSYYSDYFSSLKAAGVDFVKIDDQAHHDYLVAGGQDDVGRLRHAMLKTMRAVSNKVFGDGTTIHCMAGSPRIWGGALALQKYNGTKSLVRNSDDYFPDRDDSHRWHIFINGLNCVLTRALELVPDFDMGEELHPYGRDYHVPFRSFSPAPTYSTDVMSRPLDGEKGWSAALARTKDDRIKLVKTTTQVGAGLEGRLDDDVMGGGDGPAFVVALAFEQAKGAHLGLWNTRAEEAVSMTTIDSRDVVEALHAQPSTAVAVYVQGDDWVSWVEKEHMMHMHRARLLATPLRSIVVEPKQSRIITVAQANWLGEAEVACLGLLDKTTGLAAITSIQVVDSSFKRPASGFSSILSSAEQPSSSNANGNLALTRTFPRPSNQSRLASILTYFTTTTTIAGSQPSIEPREQIVAFGRDFARRPVSTLWAEVRIWMSFSLAVLMWTLGSRRVVANRIGSSAWRRSRVEASEEGLVTLSDEDTKEVVAPSFEGKKRLKITFGFASARVGFLVRQRVQASKPNLTFIVDGSKVEDGWILKGPLTEAGQVIELDLEGCWSAKGKPKGDEWVVEAVNDA